MSSLENVGDLSPISLCNVLYKVVSKVIANHFKYVIPSIIYEFPSVFVVDRRIIDKVLVAYETLHATK